MSRARGWRINLRSGFLAGRSFAILRRYQTPQVDFGLGARSDPGHVLLDELLSERTRTIALKERS